MSDRIDGARVVWCLNCGAESEGRAAGDRFIAEHFQDGRCRGRLVEPEFELREDRSGRLRIRRIREPAMPR